MFGVIVDGEEAYGSFILLKWDTW